MDVEEAVNIEQELSREELSIKAISMYAKGYTITEIANKLGLSTSKVFRLVSSRNCKSAKTRAPWTMADVKYLKENLDIKPIFEIAAELDKTVSDVIHRIHQLGVCDKRLDGEIIREYSDRFNIRYNNTANWTEVETAELNRLLEKGYSVEYIAETLDRTPTGIRAKIHRIKSKEQMEQVSKE